jgi:hypothetical protein
MIEPQGEIQHHMGERLFSGSPIPVHPASDLPGFMATPLKLLRQK